MLKHIEIKGYRSLKDISLNMEPLNVLIGPNGGGKSNFLEFFSFLSEAAKGTLAEGIARRGGLDTLCFRGGEKRLFFRLDFEPKGVFEQEHSDVSYKLLIRSEVGFPVVRYEQVSKGDADHTLVLVHRHEKQAGAMFRNIVSGQKEEIKELEADSELAISQVKDRTSYPTPHKILGVLSEWVLYPPIDVGPDAEIRRPQTLRAGTRRFPTCSNLVPVLYSVQNRSPATWEEMCEILRNVFEDFRYISFPPEGGDGKVILRWWEHPFEREYGFPAHLLSDGTLRFVALLALLKSPDPPPLICIDEPEIGLHPELVELVAELLQSAATRTQVIVATHSDELVSKLRPNEVVVVEKEDGETIMERLSEKELAVWLDKFRLGDLWKSGHIGGRP